MRRSTSQRRTIRDRVQRAGTPRRGADVLVEHLESRQLLATLSWDGGPSGTGTDWADPMNWVGDVVPGPSDDALIGAFAGPAIQINGAATVRSVTSSKSLSIAGSLTVSDASLFSAPVLLSGTLAGTGDCTFSSVLTWTGGVMAGPTTTGGPVGRVIINTSGTLAIAGTTHDLNRTLENNGTATWTAGAIRMAGGTFNNNSQFTASSAGGGGGGLQSFGSSSVNAFNNIGTFTKVGAGEVSFSVLAAGVAFNSLGNILLQEGTLTLAGGGSMSTPLTVNPTAAFTLGDSYTFTGNGSINGSGTVNFTGGTHSLPAGRFNPTGPVNFSGGTVTISTPFTPSALGPIGGNVTFQAVVNWSGDLTITGSASFSVAHTFSNLTLSGTLSGAGDITIPGAIAWTAGTMSGTGKTHSLPGGTITLSSVGAKILSRVLNSGGSAVWTGGDLAFAAGTFNNNGTFTADSTTTLLSYGNSGANAFVSNGTFTKLGSGEARFTTNVTGAAFNNIGTVSIVAGQLTLGGGGSASAAFNVSAGAVLAFAGNYTFAASGAVGGAGEVRFTGGTLNIPAGLFNPNGPVNFSGGTVTINNVFTPSSLGPIGGTVTFAALLNWGGAIVITGSAGFAQGQTFSTMTLAGVLTGTGDVTVTGTLSWTSGSMTGGGKTIIPVASTLAISGGATHTLSRQILSSGATNWTGGGLALNGGTFTSNGSFVADASTTLQCYGSGGTNVFTNTGTFTKLGPADALFFAGPAALPFNSTGIVTIAAGTLSLGTGSTTTAITVQGGAVLTMTGNFTYGAGGGLTGPGTVTFTGGTHTFSSGQFTTTGPLNFTGGVVTINSTFSSTALGPIAGTVNINAPVTLQSVTLSGTLGGSGDVTVTGSMTWLGGTLNGTGRVIIPASGTLTVSTGVHTLSKRLDLSGSGSWLGGDIAFSGGTFNILAGSSFAMNSNAAMQITGAGSGNAISNAGTLTKLGLGEVQFAAGAAAVALTNTGSVSVQEGTLTLGGGGSTTGSMSVALAGTLVMASGFTYSGGSVSGAGIISFTGGTHVLSSVSFNASGPVNFTAGTITIGNTFTPITLGPIAATVTFSAAVNFTGAVSITGSATFNAAQTFSSLTLSGTLTGPGSVTVTNSLTWSGGTMSGTGQTITQAGAQTSISGTGHTLSRILDVSGTATWSEGNLTLNGGVLYIRPGSTLTASPSATVEVAGSGGTNAIHILGTLTKTGTGTLKFTTGTTANPGIPTHITGLVTVQDGTLDLGGGGSFSGLFDVHTAGTLVLGATINYTAGTIQGAGAITFAAGTHVVTAAQFNPTGTVNFTGGTITVGGGWTPLALGPIGATVVIQGVLNFDDAITITGSASFAAPQTFEDMVLSGTLTGAGDITVTGELDWTGGSMSGTGRTIIPTGGELTIAGGSHTLARTITVNGSASWTAGDMAFEGGTLSVSLGATFAAEIGGSVNVSGASGVNTFNNAGSFTKSGSGTLSFGAATPGVQFVNGGTAAVQAGTLSLGAGGISPGALSITTGAALTLAGSFTYTGSGPITGGGAVTFTGGTHIIPGSQLAVTGAVNFTGGTVSVSGSFSPASLGPILGTVTFQSAIGYTGALTITGTASFAAAQTFSSLTLAGSLTGAGNITVTGALAWTGGSMTGNGVTVIAASGSATISGGTHSLSRLLQVGAAASWTAGDLVCNGGSLEILTGATLTVSTTGSITASGASGENVLTIRGTLAKAGSGTFTLGAAGPGVLLINEGTLHVQAGHFNTGGSLGNFGANTLTGGTWIVENVGFLNFPQGTQIYTNNATIRLNGVNSSFGALVPLSTNAGSLTLANGRLATFSPLGNLFTNTGTLIKEGSGSATFAAPITFNSPGTVRVTGGTLTLACPVGQITGAVLNGGSWNVSGGGVLSIPGVNIQTSHAAISISGAASSFDAVSGLRINQGSLTITGGKTFSPATFTNLGKLTIGPGSTMAVAGAFDNSFYTMNHGGILSASGGGNSTGTFWMFQGATMSLNGSHTFAGSSTLIGAGSLGIAGGSSVFNAPVNLTGMLNIAAGSASFNTDVWFWSAANSGTMNLGANKLTLIGVYTQGASAVLNVRMDSATQYGRIQAGGAITLSGRINVTWGPGYNPPIGTVFNFISGSTRVGTFANASLAPLDGRVAELEYLGTGVNLIVVPA
jgi:fibronectin-binding autotransporter adhesin